jgi:hypothetical protein
MTTYKFPRLLVEQNTLLEQPAFQLGFSMTVHKAQGRTIDTVVLDLHYNSNHRKRLGFDGIFVTLSTVRCCSSIPPIKHTHTSFEENYGRHKPAPYVMAFYRGFTGNPQEGQVWGMQLALGSTNYSNLPYCILLGLQTLHLSSLTSNPALTRLITACRVVMFNLAK